MTSAYSTVFALLYELEVKVKEYWMIYRGPGFYAPPPPTPPSSHLSKLDWPHTGRLKKRDNLLTGERGKEWGRSQIIRERENLALYKSFNTSWLKAFHDKQHQFRHEKNIFFLFLGENCTYVKYVCIYVREYKMFLKCSNRVSYFRAYHPFPFSATMNTPPPLFLAPKCPWRKIIIHL